MSLCWWGQDGSLAAQEKERTRGWVAEVTHPPCGLTPGVSCPFVANSALGGLVWSRMGEQMQQIREEVCSWVALAIWQALAEEGEERRLRKRVRRM